MLRLDIRPLRIRRPRVDNGIVPSRQTLDWRATEDGWSLGRYAVLFRGPRRWALAVDGVIRSEHPRASDAAAAAQAAERSRRRWMKIGRNGAAIAVASAALIIAQVWRFVPNPAYAAERDTVLALEDAYRSVAGGGLSATSLTGSGGITGGAFNAPPPINLGGDDPPTRDYEALVALHEGECYVVRWSPGATTRRYDIVTALFTPDLPCEVSSRLLQPELFLRSWFQSADAPAFDWDPVLPSQTFQATWFIPTVIAALLIILQGLIGTTLAMISPARARIPALVVTGNGTGTSHIRGASTPR